MAAKARIDWFCVEEDCNYYACLGNVMESNSKGRNHENCEREMLGGIYCFRKNFWSCVRRKLLKQVSSLTHNLTLTSGTETAWLSENIPVHNHNDSCVKLYSNIYRKEIYCSASCSNFHSLIFTLLTSFFSPNAAWRKGICTEEELTMETVNPASDWKTSPSINSRILGSKVHFLLEHVQFLQICVEKTEYKTPRYYRRAVRGQSSPRAKYVFP